MKQTFSSICLTLLLFFSGYANDKDSTEKSKAVNEQVKNLTLLFSRLDSIEKSIVYEHGAISLQEGNASLNVPAGFKFINAPDSRYILEDLWQNLPDESVLGMIVSDSFHVNNLNNSWVFVVTYQGMGHVKDDDADDINYDDLLKELKEGQQQANLERVKLGYDRMDLVGWASKPYYDQKNKVLHWAKELKIGEDELHTLNYDVRILGRKGVLSLNAVSDMDQLAQVKQNIPAILKMASFEKGHTYAEFNPDVDEVAAWTIGGLVAGKILVKAGVLAGILKFWKLIAIGLVTAGSFVWKFVIGKRAQQAYVPVQSRENTQDSNPA